MVLFFCSCGSKWSQCSHLLLVVMTLHSFLSKYSWSGMNASCPEAMWWSWSPVISMLSLLALFHLVVLRCPYLSWENPGHPEIPHMVSLNYCCPHRAQAILNRCWSLCAWLLPRKHLSLWLPPDDSERIFVVLLPLSMFWLPTQFTSAQVSVAILVLSTSANAGWPLLAIVTSGKHGDSRLVQNTFWSSQLTLVHLSSSFLFHKCLGVHNYTTYRWVLPAHGGVTHLYDSNLVCFQLLPLDLNLSLGLWLPVAGTLHVLVLSLPLRFFWCSC